MTKERVPALEVVGKPIKRGRALPKAPEVDEDALERAESQMGHENQKPATVKALPVKTAGRRRKRKERQEEILYIKGPKEVIDAFLKFKQDERFKANWDALLDLLTVAGIEVEDFDP